MKCDGSTYVSVGLASDEGPFTQTAECNGPRGCGWLVVLSEWHGFPDGTWDTAITSEEFLPLHEQHLSHSRGDAGSLAVETVVVFLLLAASFLLLPLAVWVTT